MNDELKLLSPHEFPPLLKEISGCPKKLYVRGSLPDTNRAWLAVVGSRAMTPYGRQACRELITGLRGHPVVIVSGLALGVDAEAHRIALQVGLPTVAVLGSGLNWNLVGPRTNYHLAREIIAHGGALVSEYDPATPATVWSFPQRDRIMAGLSHATLLVEAKEKSGTLITAKLTVDFNRELLVVPGSIFSEMSRGVHQFLKLGATPITSSEDILAALGFNTDGQHIAEELLPDMSDDEKRIWLLLATGRTRDELVREIGMETAEAQVILSMMELKGLLVEELGLLRRA